MYEGLIRSMTRRNFFTGVASGAAAAVVAGGSASEADAALQDAKTPASQGLKYSQYLFSDLKDPISTTLKYMDSRPAAYFRGAHQIPGASINMGWQVIKQGGYFMEKEGHYHLVDEYFAILGAELPDVFSSFDAEVELWMGPEQEKHVITKPTFVFIPAGFQHCPLNFKKVNKPLLFQAIHLGPYFQKIQNGQWYGFLGPGKSMALWKGHPNWLAGPDPDLPESKPGSPPKYSQYLFSDLQDSVSTMIKYMDPRPTAYFRGGHQIPGASINMGWQVIKSPFLMEQVGHHHMVDEYFAILGAELPDVFSSFDAEIELCMGPEEEKHVITKPTFVFIPKGFHHCPLNFKKVNKPILFQAIHLGPYFHEINQGRWVYFMGPGKATANFGPPPKKSP